jgi:hypothetical protein
MTTKRRMRFGTLVLAAVLMGAACGDGDDGGGGDDGGDRAGSATTVADGAAESTTSTTREPAFPAPPDGVYEATITVDDWTAAGNPADTFAEVNEEGHYILTLDAGSIHVDCAFADGHTESCFDGTYTSIGPDEIVVGDPGGTGSARWSFADDELRFTIDDPDRPAERAIFASQPWIKIG